MRRFLLQATTSAASVSATPTTPVSSRSVLPSVKSVLTSRLSIVSPSPVGNTSIYFVNEKQNTICCLSGFFLPDYVEPASRVRVE